MKTYLDLTRPAPVRLAALRLEAHKRFTEALSAGREPEAAIAHWRTLRTEGARLDNFLSYCGHLDQGKNGDAPIWYTHQGEYFRGEVYADEVARAEGSRSIDHKGWFTDSEFQEEVMRGIVARLPHGRFLAGYYMSMNGERVYYPEVFDDQLDAARMADEHARVSAERECEYQDRSREANKRQEELDAALERIKEVRAIHSALIRRLRCLGFGDDATGARKRDDYRTETSANVERVRELRDELESYKDVL